LLRSLIAVQILLWSGPGAAWSVDGCKRASDPYNGNPPVPKGLVRRGPVSDRLVVLADRISDLREALAYAGTDNVIGRAVYPKEARCLVHPALARALAAAAVAARAKGFGLSVYDCYRPWRAQVALWSVCPKRGLVADPARGSKHNRGVAVDLSLYRLADGVPLEMPSGYDDLSRRARHNYRGGTAAQRANRALLKSLMIGAGLRAIGSEWWHYELYRARRYPLLDLPLTVNSKRSKESR
jgi:D-alanyl-D-alanine dipeptidase